MQTASAYGVDDFLRDWGSLIVTVILAILTGWYAVLTRSIAKASGEAAQSSADAAQAALEAANAARSSLQIEFKAKPIQFSKDTNPPRFSAVDVTCVGSNLYVHGLDLCSVKEAQPDAFGSAKYVTVSGEELALTTDELLPRLLHQGESMRFWLPEGHVYRVAGGVAALMAKVHYSLSGSGRIDVVEARYP